MPTLCSARAREDARADLMRARHRLSKLLLRHEVIYESGRAWTARHDAWLRRQRPGARAAFEDYYGAVLAAGFSRDGSRFGTDGSVLEGPATTPLEHRSR